MKPENVVYAVAGTLFGLIVGWMIGTQQTPGRVPAVAPATTTAAPAPSAPAATTVLDESQVAALKTVASGDPKNVESRIQLGNLYFDAGRYRDAIAWYEQALALNPKDANVSTDLAVCFYYTDQADKSVAQFEQSLAIDPTHAKTYLNMGVVKAFGKQDLAGATAAWEQAIKIAPGTDVAQAAQRALDNLKAAHPGGAATPVATK